MGWQEKEMDQAEEEAENMMEPPESVHENESPLVIRVYTFGPLKIEWQRHTTAFPEARLHGRGAAPALSFLKALLCQPQRFALRDWIMEQFWPEMKRSQAEERLHDVASWLRTLLRPSEKDGKYVYFVAAGPGGASGYRLETYPRLWVDADAFRWYVEQAARLERFGQPSLDFWERAYQLASRGPFLPEERYSDWSTQRRQEIEGQYQQCVHRLTHLLREAGHIEEALLRLRLFWQQHQSDEDMLRPLMEMLGERERFQEAEQYYQQAIEALKQEGREPDACTVDVHEYLRARQIQRQPVPSQKMSLTMPSLHFSSFDDKNSHRDIDYVSAQQNVQNMGIPRRQLLQLGITSAGGFLFQPSYHLIHSEQEMVERLARALEKPSQCDSVFLTHLEATTRGNRKRFVLSKDCMQDMFSLHQDMIEQLSLLTQLLEAALPTSTHHFLCTLVAETAQLLGDICFYQGDGDAALVYYNVAIRAAQEADNHVLQAVIVGRKSFVPLYHGQAREALLFMQQAHTLTSDTTADGVRAWLLVVEAEIQADLGEGDACERALGQSELLLQRAHPGDSTCSFTSEAHYAPLNTQRWLGYAAACYLRLSQPQKAQPLLQTYLATSSYASFHKQATTFVDLAHSYAQQGNIERMHYYAQKALYLFEQTRSSRVLQRLRRLRQAADQWKEEPSLKEFDRQLLALSIPQVSEHLSDQSSGKMNGRKISQ